MIKEYRKKRNLTQKELANQVGVTQAYICALESGKRSNPSAKILLKISAITGAPLQGLLQQYSEVS